jgi:hypothetical protein
MSILYAAHELLLGNSILIGLTPLLVSVAVLANKFFPSLKKNLH